MKTKFLLGIFALTVMFMLFPQKSFSEVKKYYIIFDNFEDQIGSDGNVITNLFDVHYWNDLKANLTIGAYMEKKPFSAATFAARNITDYDVAIFVMGKYNLSASVDGINVFDKIQEMITAGKSVIIIGAGVVQGAFNGEAKIKNWMQNWMGITNPKDEIFVVGSSIYGMQVNGIEGDPVSKGFKKQMNRKYKQNDQSQWAEPFRYYNGVTYFTVSGGNKSKAIDNIFEVKGDTVKDIRTVAVRAEKDLSRVVLWTTNFDMATYPSDFSQELIDAIRWCIANYPHPEGFLEPENSTLDFDKVEINQTGYLVCPLRNKGRLPFTISKFELAGDAPAGIFKIIEGGDQPVTLNPGDIHLVNLSFTPNSSDEFTDGLILTSDAYIKEIVVNLIGTGGDQVFNGPRISVTKEPVNFGSIPYSQFSDKNIQISNTGTVALIVDTIKITDNGGGRFTYPKTVSVPKTILPGKTENILVRFTSQDEEPGTFTGSMHIHSNGLNNNGNGEIVLKAASAGKTSKSGVVLSTTNIHFGEVKVGKADTVSVLISNVGTTVLKIFDDIIFAKSGGGENLAQFAFVDGTNENIPDIQPGTSYKLKIKFEPENAKTYTVKIQINTNDEEVGIFEVPVTGIGIPATDVKENIASTSGLEVKLYPNPVVDNAKVEFNVEKAGKISMDLIDFSGRKIQNLYSDFANEGIFFKEFSTTNLANGTYFINVNYNGKKLQISFVVSK